MFKDWDLRLGWESAIHNRPSKQTDNDSLTKSKNGVNKKIRNDVYNRNNPKTKEGKAFEQQM